MTGNEESKAQVAIRQIERIGGTIVWEPDLCVVDLSETSVTDSDLALFEDLPFVEIVSLAKTSITDAGLCHLEGMTSLRTLIMVDTDITLAGVNRLRAALPSVEIRLKPTAERGVDPIIGDKIDRK